MTSETQRGPEGTPEPGAGGPEGQPGDPGQEEAAKRLHIPSRGNAVRHSLKERLEKLEELIGGDDDDEL